MAAAIRDVSERNELEDERRRKALAAQGEQSHHLESLGELAGSVAHDFNNLLGVILNYSTLLARRITDPTEVSYVEEIRAAAERGAGLTRHLLTLARRDLAAAEPLELNEIVSGIASMLDRTLGEHITVELDLARLPLGVFADRQQLEQIVLNLATNARDAMPTGGVLRIVTTAEDGGAGSPAVILEVIDAGHGMPPEVVARAFERFFTTKPKGQGTGLGLATVYGIVRQSGGTVTIDSGVGAGTTVTVVLPGADPAGSADDIVGASSCGTERILLVEDEAALRTATERLLRDEGYDVVVAGDGIDALEVFDGANSAFDLVLTDVSMPRMRGDELARRVRARRPGLPIIFVSGHDSGDAPVTGRLLVKPVADDDLLRTIREVLDD